jgi:hypothetical protein
VAEQPSTPLLFHAKQLRSEVEQLQPTTPLLSQVPR